METLPQHQVDLLARWLLWLIVNTVSILQFLIDTSSAKLKWSKNLPSPTKRDGNVGESVLF